MSNNQTETETEGEEDTSTPDVAAVVAYLRPVVASTVILFAIIGSLALAVTLTSPIYAALLAGAFVAGALVLPLFNTTVGPSLPPIFREPLAGLMLVLAALPYPRAVLEQQEDLSYRLVPAEEHEGAQGNWTRWLWTEFGVGLRVDDSLWTDLVVDDATVRGLTGQEQTDGGVMLSPIERNDEPTFVPEDMSPENVVIPLAEPLSRLQNAAGVISGFEAESAGLEEFGGDTGQHSQRMMFAGVLTFVVLGVVLGWVMFW